jgi:hypothetical protein
MNDPLSGDRARLAHQSLHRPFSPAERRLADALEKIFATGEHDFAAVVAALQRDGVPRPSGAGEPWSVAALESELKRLNDLMDDAYVRREQRAGGP